MNLVWIYTFLQNSLYYPQKGHIYHFSFFLPVDPPKITKHPESKSVATGASATFTIEVTGDDLQFMWQKNGIDLSDNDRHHGIDTDTMRIVNVEKVDNKSHYQCLVKNDMKKKLSQQAVLTVSK